MYPMFIQQILLKLARFCMQIYFPTWFSDRIKEQNKLMDQKICLICIKEFKSFLTANVKDIASKVVKRNAYFAHLENIMLAMLADENEEDSKCCSEEDCFFEK